MVQRTLSNTSLQNIQETLNWFDARWPIRLQSSPSNRPGGDHSHRQINVSSWGETWPIRRWEIVWNLFLLCTTSCQLKCPHSVPYRKYSFTSWEYCWAGMPWVLSLFSAQQRHWHHGVQSSRYKCSITTFFRRTCLASPPCWRIVSIDYVTYL